MLVAANEVGQVATSGQERTSTAESAGTISVSVIGKAKSAPTSVELTGSIAADAELAGDALAKFAGSKAAALAAVEKMNLSQVTVETSGFSIGTPIMDPTASILSRTRGTVEPLKVTIQETIRVRMAGIDRFDRQEVIKTLIRLIDVLKESGVTFGPPAGTRILTSRDDGPGIVTFRVDDVRSLEEQAEVEAMKIAQRKAERLARLSGTRIGEVRSVSSSTRGASTYSISGTRTASPEESSKLGDIEIDVVLNVQYSLRQDAPSSR
jgi:uncharacterized protein YggE